MEFSAFKYRIPFTRRFVTGAGSWDQRKGVLISLSNGSVTGWGEAAPLPRFSPDSLEDVVLFLSQNGRKIRSYLKKKMDGDETPTDRITPLPSLQFALDTLLADLYSQQNRTHLSNLFSDVPRHKLPVNAILQSHDVNASIDEAGELWKKGFRTFKFKIGNRFETEFECIRKVRELFPTAKIRIDANQSWGVEEAESHLARMRGLDIEYCEEPISNPTRDSLYRIKRYTDIPIALDESLYQPRPEGSTDKWMEESPAEVIIMKPMILGSFKKIFETYHNSVTHNYRVVCTTSLESGIGRMMTACIASGLGSPRHASGLATGNLLKMDVWNDRSYIDSGYFSLPDSFGLGQECRYGIKNLALSSLEV